MTDVDLWICSRELGFVLKLEQREAMELLLRGKNVFSVLPTGVLPHAKLLLVPMNVFSVD